MGKASKDRRDIYYRKAKEDSHRARSAYKLLQLDEEYNLFANDVNKVVDLCAAPGSWSQVIRAKLPQKGLVVAVDLQEMADIPGVTQIRGDISSIETIKQILSAFGNEKADLIVCDGAPDVTGMHDIDVQLQHRLLISALLVCLLLLKPNGKFVAKIFRGRHIGTLFAQFFDFFETVNSCKPASSRASSLEGFLVCQGFQ